jgi:PAS domain S-box-containing protein
MAPTGAATPAAPSGGARPSARAASGQPADRAGTDRPAPPAGGAFGALGGGQRALQRAAWPDLFASLQAAYANLNETELALERQRQELAAARDLFVSVVETISDALFLLDRRGRVTRANRAARELLGRDESELAGRPFAELVVRGAVPTTPRAVLERSPRGVVEGLEGQLRSRAGHAVDVSLGITVLRDPVGRIAGVVVAARDVRPTKRRLDDLRTALALQARFASSVRRELRGPLATAGARLRALQATADADPELAGALDALGRLERALDETLEVLRIQSGRLRLRLASVDLVGLARATLATVASRDQRGHRFELVAPRAALVGHWDAERLGRALDAVLDNAARHSPPGTVVRLSIQQQGEQAIVRVHDVGPGIPPDEEPRLFEPFFRGRLAQGAGLGLGLFLARSLIRLHGGRLALEQSGPSGSVFRLQLPLRRPRRPPDGPGDH